MCTSPELVIQNKRRGRPLNHRLPKSRSITDNNIILVFLESLDPPDYADDLARIQEPNRETCLWIEETENFIKWQNEPRPCVFHLSGKPGTGKSVLTKRIYGQIKSKQAIEGSKTCESLYYFCNNRKRGNGETATNILRALIHQLVSKERLPHLIDAVFESCQVLQTQGKSLQKEAENWSFQRLSAIYNTAVESSGLEELCIIIDALDECKEDSVGELLTSMATALLNKATGTRVKLFVASRIAAYIEEDMHDAFQLKRVIVFNLRIMPELNENDIKM